MLDKIMVWVAKIAAGKKILAALESCNSKLSGYRSEIILALMALVWLLEKVGVLPVGSFESASPVLLGALPITMADKAKRAIETAEKIIPKK